MTLTLCISFMSDIHDDVFSVDQNNSSQKDDDSRSYVSSFKKATKRYGLID